MDLYLEIMDMISYSWSGIDLENLCSGREITVKVRITWPVIDFENNGVCRGKNGHCLYFPVWMGFDGC